MAVMKSSEDPKRAWVEVDGKVVTAGEPETLMLCHWKWIAHQWRRIFPKKVPCGGEAENG